MTFQTAFDRGLSFVPDIEDQASQFERDLLLEAPPTQCPSCRAEIPADEVYCECGWEDEEFVAWLNAQIQAWGWHLDEGGKS